MGGRGSSSGISTSGKTYGSEYTTVYKTGNIKFVKQVSKSSVNTPMETMTKGRVYVTIGSKEEIKSITYYDNYGKKIKQIDLTHTHTVNGKKLKPHTHKGYFHDEKGTNYLTQKEKAMVDRVIKTWDYYKGKKRS